MRETWIQAVVCEDIDNHGLPRQGGVQAGPATVLVLAFVQMHCQLTGEDNGLRLVVVDQGHRHLIGVGHGLAGERSNPPKVSFKDPSPSMILLSSANAASGSR